MEEAGDLEGELVIDLQALPEEAAKRLQALEVEEERRKLEGSSPATPPSWSGPR